MEMTEPIPRKIKAGGKVKERTIYEWVRTNKIPYKKIGDLLRFKKSEIFKWIEQS